MRSHPLITRIAATAAVVVCGAALLILWQLRPGLPHISSLTAAFTTAIIQQAIVCVIWALSLYVALSVLVHAGHAIIHPPQRTTILPGVIPTPPLPRPRASVPTSFPRLTLTPVGRPAPSPPDPQVTTPTETPPTATPPPAAPPDESASPPAPSAGEQQPALSISVLGPLRIEGTSRKPRRVATRELIAYLALHPNGASRDELIEAMWPAQDPKQTRPRLWQAATDARAALGDAWVLDGEHYRLDRTKAHIDLDQLDQLLANGENEPEALDNALALWRGEPLAGSDYAWADTHIHRLHATLIGLLERAGHARLERGDINGALELAERAIALDQFHEASWRLALQAEHALGLRESITRRYDELTHALDEQLGLQPTRETRVMYRQLLGQS